MATIDKEFFQPLASMAHAKVTFRSVEKDDSGRLGVQVKVDRSPEEFICHIKSKLSGFPKHRFLAHNQDNEFAKLLLNLDLDHLVILSDFAEKFSPKEFEEIQSIHWHGHSYTIFTSVAYCHAFVSEEEGFKKVKFYFCYFSEREQQDNFMSSHCREKIVKWLFQKLNLTFKKLTLASDKCAYQFCSRKVFGPIAESRRNLCVNHESSESLCPNCPRVGIHFSCAGHGKKEVDHAGAYAKTKCREEGLAKRPLRTIDDVANFLPTINFLDLNKTRPGMEDHKGFFYSGFIGEVVNPRDVKVSTLDWDPVDHTRDLHQLSTTSIPGELLTRESSCFSCASCEEGDLFNCSRTEELGFVEKVMVKRVSGNKRSARDRTRQSQDRQRHGMAELAMAGSVIAIALGVQLETTLVLITKPMGQLADRKQLQGKTLTKIAPNQFSTIAAQTLEFHAATVRSPPLMCQKSSTTSNGGEDIVFVIEDYELNGLINEYLV